VKRADPDVKALQRMLGHAFVSMTLDIYSDLFDGDLDAVAGPLDQGLAQTDVGKRGGKRSRGMTEGPETRAIPRN